MEPERCGMPVAMLTLAAYGLMLGGFVTVVMLAVMWLVWG